MSPMLPALLLMAASTTAVIGVAALPDERSPFVGIVAGDLPHAAGIAAAADGRVVGPGRLPFVWLVASAQPDRVGRLHRAGAWLVLGGFAGCGPTNSRL